MHVAEFNDVIDFVNVINTAFEKTPDELIVRI